MRSKGKTRINLNLGKKAAQQKNRSLWYPVHTAVDSTLLEWLGFFPAAMEMPLSRPMVHLKLESSHIEQVAIAGLQYWFFLFIWSLNSQILFQLLKTVNICLYILHSRDQKQTFVFALLLLPAQCALIRSAQYDKNRR